MKPRRLLLASSRAPHVTAAAASAREGTAVLRYQYEACTLDHILEEVAQTLGQKKAEGIAMLMHSSDSEIFVCSPGEKVLSVESVQSDVSMREFLSRLAGRHLDPATPGCHIVFLAAAPAASPAGHGDLICRQLQLLLGVTVGMSKDLLGSPGDLFSSDLYLDPRVLSDKLQESAYADQLQGYEKLRTVGKGAFGVAVLYRRTADDSLVVMKQVNMTELTAAERQMALNEVQVLALLHHPNIIRYLGSFELDGVLMIEMEYADGGTLAERLAQAESRLGELEIVTMFGQIVAAIRYMHDHNILHRDLKTANVFLTKDSTIKVGDFGISKMMTTRGQAQTVLGTPYYISPEMCEGKQYDQKSDIWALGCILYEMACLQKTFEGSNLPALVNKIMKGQFQPVSGGYSAGLRQLVHDLLQREPVFRPTAAELAERRLPALLQALKEGREPEGAPAPSRNSKPERSVLYDLRVFESHVALTPVPLPPRSKVTDVAASNTHVLALTADMLVYSWGEGSRGQLGHGDTVQHTAQPRCVDALKGKSITRVGAGDGYSAFVSDSGMLMTCGDGTFGCLGHGDWNNVLRPKLVESLLSVDVAAMSCGSHHVAVVSVDGELFAWGRGDGGRLGLGHQDDCCAPAPVGLPGDHVVRTVHCGADATAVVTTEGALLACGRNSCNKLGLHRAPRLFPLCPSKQAEVGRALELTRVRLGGARAVSVSLGADHTAVLTEAGQVLTLGRNSEAQLGRGHARPCARPALVRGLADQRATMVQCGPTYTVAGTIENAVYFWGTRYNTINYQDLLKSSLVGYEASGAWSSYNASGKAPQGPHAAPQYSNVFAASGPHDSLQSEVVLEPEEVLALYASPGQLAKGEAAVLAGLHPARAGLLVHVDTTVPLARVYPRQDLQSGSSGDDSDSDLPGGGSTREAAEYDSIGPIPDWIRAELAQSEAAWVDLDSRGAGR
ncbi:serine/threonine-protein kinase Nek8-like [Bacillus rossius redtenbacheri]|uniref:serine/threonine-protein kinase Nek8-like n=1 Tax=Bacillus rossius redtenbacheri TaxID=93214 RepID=UPI002FDECC0A